MSEKVTDSRIFSLLIQPHGHLILFLFFLRIETGHEVLDEMIGR